MEKEQEIIRTSLRLPKKLYDRIASAADQHGLTMHAEILARIESSFAPAATERGLLIPGNYWLEMENMVIKLSEEIEKLRLERRALEKLPLKSDTGK